MQTRGKMFGLISLSIVSVLSIALFMWRFISLWIEVDKYSDYYEDVDMFLIIKIVGILCLCLTFALLSITYVGFDIKETSTKNVILVIEYALGLLEFMFYVVCAFCLSNYQVVFFNYLFLSSIISIINTFLIFSITKKEKSVEKSEERSTEEIVINDEINKLKAKIRIKNLEEEYFSLKAQLEEKNQKNLEKQE